VTSTHIPGTVVQSWVPVALAEQLKAQAELERRSVSATIRLAVEDRLRREDRRDDFAAPSAPAPSESRQRAARIAPRHRPEADERRQERPE
jgi:hypothetical protein